jgi:hypothetical protein
VPVACLVHYPQSDRGQRHRAQHDFVTQGRCPLAERLEVEDLVEAIALDLGQVIVGYAGRFLDLADGQAQGLPAGAQNFPTIVETTDRNIKARPGPAVACWQRAALRELGAHVASHGRTATDAGFCVGAFDHPSGPLHIAG